MTFSYVAKKISGEETRGSMEAKTRFELAKLLKEQGFVLVSYKEKKSGAKFNISIPFLERISIAEKMIFCRNLGVMVGAGLSVTRGLDILGRQTKNQKFKKIIFNLMEKIQKGTAVSEAMKNYPTVFSSLFTAMVKVGEESGQLAESLKLISDQLERDHTLIKKVKGALIYPAVVVTAMILIGILMMIYVVPTLVATFKDLNVELPTSTKVVINISDFLKNHTVLFFSALFGFVIALISLARTETGRRAISTILLKLPIFSNLIKKINAARTSRTLASLISAGVNVVEALSITQNVLQNFQYKKVLEEAKKIVQKGSPISEAFKKAENLYPLLVGEMMAVGEETGKMSDMLLRLATFYEDEVAETTKDMSTIIEPILMIIIGAAVGLFAISMIKPMYSMMDGI